MKHLLTAITAIILSCTNVFAQSNPVNQAVPQKGPTIRVIELSHDLGTQTGLLRIEFESSTYPVRFLVNGDSLIYEVKNPKVKMVELYVRYTLTEEFRRKYDLHVANRTGKEYVGVHGFSQPSITDALKR